MEDPFATELLLIACELAVQVECRPRRSDGSDAAIYGSSGATVARRIRAGAVVEATCNETPLAPDLAPAPFCWDVLVQAGAARQTNYKLWLRESGEELRALRLAREQARALRASLPHAQRKKRPWGPL